MTSKSPAKICLSSRFVGLEKNVWISYQQIMKEHTPTDFSTGFPNFPRTVNLDDFIPRISPDSSMHHYTGAAGSPNLLKAVSRVYSKLHARIVSSTDNILVTIGADHGLSCALSSLINPGDEVILFEPHYLFYVPFINTVLGATARILSLWPRSGQQSGEPEAGSNNTCAADWTFSEDELRQLVSSKTKAILINTPHNPTGKVFSLYELEIIARVCVENDLLCFSDEVYEWLVYPSRPNSTYLPPGSTGRQEQEHHHIRICMLEGMYDRTLSFSSGGKAFGLTGWKIGWIIGPKYLIDCCKIAHSWSVGSCPAPMQDAVAFLMENNIDIDDISPPSVTAQPRDREVPAAPSPLLPQHQSPTSTSFFTSYAKLVSEKHDFLVSLLVKKGFVPVSAQAGFFVLVNWRGARISGFSLNRKDPEQLDDVFLANWLITHKKLAVIPSSYFFTTDRMKRLAQDFVRFCFCKSDETFQQLVDVLENL